jgi:hypothetical protein
MCITLGYPDRKSERELLVGGDRREAIGRLAPRHDAGRAGRGAAAVQSVHASDALLDYLQSLIATTRSGAWFVEGLSPRAGRRRAARGARRASSAAATTSRPTTSSTCCRRRSPIASSRSRAPAAPSEQVRAMIEAVALHVSALGRARDGSYPPDGTREARRTATERASLVAPLERSRPRRALLTSRLPRTDNPALTQGNVYILPTPAGWMFALTLVVLLLASVNYQLNLGYGADLPARRQRHRLDAHHARHAARPDAAPASRRAGLSPGSPGGARHRHDEPRRRRASASACASSTRRRRRWHGPTFPPAARRRRSQLRADRARPASTCRR